MFALFDFFQFFFLSLQIKPNQKKPIPTTTNYCNQHYNQSTTNQQQKQHITTAYDARVRKLLQISNHNLSKFQLPAKFQNHHKMNKKKNFLTYFFFFNEIVIVCDNNTDPNIPKTYNLSRFKCVNSIVLILLLFIWFSRNIFKCSMRNFH